MSNDTNQVLQDVTVEMTAEQEACRKAEKRRFVICSGGCDIGHH